MSNFSTKSPLPPTLLYKSPQAQTQFRLSSGKGTVSLSQTFHAVGLYYVEGFFFALRVMQRYEIYIWTRRTSSPWPPLHPPNRRSFFIVGGIC